MIPEITIIIPTYGLMATIGALLAILFLYYNLMVCENNLNISKMSEFWLLCVLCGLGCLIGSRLIYVLSQLKCIIENLSVQNIIDHVFFGGFVFYGGLIGAFIGAFIYSKIKHVDKLELYNVLTPGFVIFHAAGRIGCLFAGCCYGFKLEKELVVGNVHFNYFPIQAVEAVFEFLIFFLLCNSSLKKKRFISYMTVYPIYRFIAEFFRGDIERGLIFNISTSQIISILILIYVLKTLFISKNGSKALIN